MTIVACVYIAVGTIGFAYHFRELLARNAFQYDAALIELTEFVAILCGAFLLRGRNWARWVALAWMAFHVIFSAFDSFPKFAIHSVFLAVITWFLFRPPAARYFRRAPIESS